MATLKHRIRRKNSNGSYDVVHYETESGLVVRPNNETVEAALTKTLRITNAEDVVPGFNAKIDADTLQGKTAAELVEGYAKTTDLESVKTSVSEGKKLIAAAVTDKGMETAADATFKTMADNIESIVGIDIIDYKIKSSSTTSVLNPDDYDNATAHASVYGSSYETIPNDVKRVMHYSLYKRSSDGNVIAAWIIDYDKNLAITMTLRGYAVAIKTYKISENDTIQLHGSDASDVKFTYNCTDRTIITDYKVAPLTIWYQY